MPTKKPRYTFILTDSEKDVLIKQSMRMGFDTLSDYIRSMLGLRPLSKTKKNSLKQNKTGR